MLHEEEEQVEFFAGERHLLALQEDLTGFRTDIEVADIEALFCLRVDGIRLGEAFVPCSTFTAKPFPAKVCIPPITD